MQVWSGDAGIVAPISLIQLLAGWLRCADNGQAQPTVAATPLGHAAISLYADQARSLCPPASGKMRSGDAGMLASLSLTRAAAASAEEGPGLRSSVGAVGPSLPVVNTVGYGFP